VLLYESSRRASMLLPNACDVDWTDLTRVFSDNVPAPAGIGAVQTAQQALGLTTAEAATLVSNAGGNSSISTESLAQATHQANIAAAQAKAASGRKANGVRLPIGPNVNPSQAFLNGDTNRTLLLLQNNNATGGANLLWSVDAAIDTTNPQFYVNLAPGLGVLLDEEVLINPIYVAWGPGTVTGGVCLYGSGASAGPAGGGVISSGGNATVN
jgi:hypothetical protein